MLKVGVDFNVNVGEKILFIVGCYKGNLILVKYLIEVGVDINVNIKDEILLIFVSKYGYLYIV